MGSKLSKNKGLNNEGPRLGQNRLDWNGREQDKAILELKKQRDILKLFQKNMGVDQEKERNQVKKLLSEGNKDRAKYILKKKRFREVLMEKTDRQLVNIDEMCHGLEFAEIEITVLESLKAGNTALKLVLDEMMSIDKIDQLMEETRDGIDRRNDINKLFSTHLTQQDLQYVENELRNLMPHENYRNSYNNDDEAPTVSGHVKDVEKLTDHRIPIADAGIEEDLEVEDVLASQDTFPATSLTPLLAKKQRNAAKFNVDDLELPDVPKPHEAKAQLQHEIDHYNYHKVLAASAPVEVQHKVLAGEIEHHTHHKVLAAAPAPVEVQHKVLAGEIEHHNTHHKVHAAPIAIQHKGVFGEVKHEKVDHSVPDHKKQAHRKKKKSGNSHKIS